ncbi:hypothetical protein K437DRAFT_263910 [Tilletiaria anomala UBC 951]|uniref:Uncharacterized protein n=1 Tax=Tilletiaria anomala (strain ATCC 24038 / CBS 436.72 / UBC 951) TaxID=1037660 RepID=A0A066VNM1_TILAU|nr:uncharacterized protein K437DRAFT_263910 [Tilletiaria anomala UBC 951]KDN41873.1 hypothetical protein K437DRAFT_263910 [Tilletiaria anomala UBC 951]
MAATTPIPAAVRALVFLFWTLVMSFVCFNRSIFVWSIWALRARSAASGSARVGGSAGGGASVPEDADHFCACGDAGGEVCVPEGVEPPPFPARRFMCSGTGAANDVAEAAMSAMAIVAVIVVLVGRGMDDSTSECTVKRSTPVHVALGNWPAKVCKRAPLDRPPAFMARMKWAEHVIGTHGSRLRVYIGLGPTWWPGTPRAKRDPVQLQGPK